MSRPQQSSLQLVITFVTLSLLVVVPGHAIPSNSTYSFSHLLRGRNLEVTLGDVIARLLSSFRMDFTPPELATNRGGGDDDQLLPASSELKSTLVDLSSKRVPLEVRAVRRGTVERVERPGRGGSGRGRESGLVKKGLKPQRVLSQPLQILDGTTRGGGRSLKEVEVQGVKIIIGERVPDSPEDKFMTWRNARVIKGHLVPNEEQRR